MECASAVVGDLARPQNMSAALADVDAVIHSAGVAHAMSGLPEDDYRMLNTEATIALARAAQRAGARRFVFLSSMRAQCGPSAEHVLTEELAAQPTDGYGRSKLAAEQGLAQLDLDWVALRLVLVYGAGREGQHGAAAAARALALPAAVRCAPARRSLLALDNLVAAVDAVLAAPQPLARPLIVADTTPLTIPEMVTAMRRGLGRRPGLIPVPPALLETSLRVAGGRRSTSGWPARWWPIRRRSWGWAGDRRSRPRRRWRRSHAADTRRGMTSGPDRRVARLRLR